MSRRMTRGSSIVRRYWRRSGRRGGRGAESALGGEVESPEPIGEDLERRARPAARPGRWLWAGGGERPRCYLCGMLGKLAGWEDTIVALATPPGVGAIGVIRVSGSLTFAIVDKLFVSKDLSAQATHTMHVGLLKEGDETLDEVVVRLF